MATKKMPKMQNLYNHDRPEESVCLTCGNIYFEEHPEHKDVFWCPRCGRAFADAFKFIALTSKKSEEVVAKKDEKKK